MGSEKKAVDASQPLSLPAHSLLYEDVLRELSVDSDEGLTTAEAKKRLEQYGPNELEGGESVSMVKIVIRQIANAMMLVSILFQSTKLKYTDHNRFSSSPWLSVLVSSPGLRVV